MHQTVKLSQVNSLYHHHKLCYFYPHNTNVSLHLFRCIWASNGIRDTPCNFNAHGWTVKLAKLDAKAVSSLPGKQQNVQNETWTFPTQSSRCSTFTCTDLNNLLFLFTVVNVHLNAKLTCFFQYPCSISKRVGLHNWLTSNLQNYAPLALPTQKGKKTQENKKTLRDHEHANSVDTKTNMHRLIVLAGIILVSANFGHFCSNYGVYWGRLGMKKRKPHRKFRFQRWQEVGRHHRHCQGRIQNLFLFFILNYIFPLHWGFSFFSQIVLYWSNFLELNKVL